MVNIAVFISGNGTNLQSLIDATKDKFINGKIKLVFSNRKKAFGLIRAKNENIDTLYLNRKNFSSNEDYDMEILKNLNKKNIDLIVLCGYLNILSYKLIKSFDKKIINIHPSLIPSFCGCGFFGENVHKEVIKRGVKFTGATTHFVDENVDTGLIILQDIVRVNKNDDYISISKKVLEVEHKILVKTIKAFCDKKIVLKDDRAFILED